MMATFIKLTEYSGKAVFINPAFVSVIEEARQARSGFSENFYNAKVHTTNWLCTVRETPKQILALIKAATTGAPND